MNISELGEFELIELLQHMVDDTRDNNLSKHPELVLGIGDDAAAWQGDVSIQLATTDVLVQDVHFNLDFTSWADLGWKAMAVNLSDIAAMGGIPQYALVSLSLPASTLVESVTDLYRGMIELAKRFDTIIVGGNISRAPQVILNITVLGTIGKLTKHILTRSGAGIGDKIAVTGYLGASAGGLKILKKNIKLDPESEKTLKQSYLRPSPRINEGQILVEQGVRSAIDISDGLIADLGHICKSSKVGARIEVSLIPVHPEVIKNFGENALNLALSGGEDYELLFTAPPEVVNRVNNILSCPVTVIGEIIGDNPGNVLIMDENGQSIVTKSAGWKHF